MVSQTTDAGKVPFGTVLRSLADAAPDRPAVTCGADTVSRRELLGRTLRVAGYLRGQGVEPSSLVTIALPNSIDAVTAMLATWWLGATPQPVSPRLAAAEQSDIIALADPAVVIGDGIAGAGGRPTVSGADLAREGESGPGFAEEPEVAAVWKVVTSGGSTGRPKLIMATQPAYASSVTPLGGMLHMPVEGCVVMTAPLSHNAPLVASIATLLLGSHLVLMPRFDPSEASAWWRTTAPSGSISCRP